MSAEILKQELKSHFQAGYPAVFIQTGEEARLDAILKELCDDLQWHAMEWNLGYGWVCFANKQPTSAHTDRTDLASCLPRLLDDDLSNKLIVIKDARLALENQDLAVARLKQLLNRIERHHRGNATVVLVSESQFIPQALEAQVTLLHMPLPSQQEIADILKSDYQGVAYELVPRLAATCSGLNLAEIHLVLSKVGRNLDALDESALDTIHKEKAQIISKSGVLEMVKVTEGPDDIGGLANLKEWLNRRATIFERLNEAKLAGIQPPKGVLIAGMPGCGKSLTAKAAAGLFKLPLLRLDIGSLLGKYVGESEHNMRRALRLAESVSPCVLWIDELEKAFVGMGSGAGSEVSSRLFGYFLTWMQEKSGAVFVIATANDISALPPELLRKGRFDEVFYVGFPNNDEREAILSIHAKDNWKTLSRDEQKWLITGCRDFAGSDIQNAINEARENAFLDQNELNYSYFSTAIKATIPLRETLKQKVGDYERKFDELKLKSASRGTGLTIAQMVGQSNDPNPLKRKEVADNIDCTSDILKTLSKDKETIVRHAAYQNPNCPVDVFSEMLTLNPKDSGYDKDCYIYSCIHQNTPMDLLASLLSKCEEGKWFIDSASDEKIASSKHLTKGVIFQLFRLGLRNDAIDVIYNNWRNDIDIGSEIILHDKGSAEINERICSKGIIRNDVYDYLFEERSYLNSYLCLNPNTPEAFIYKLLTSNIDLSAGALFHLCERQDFEISTFEALAEFLPTHDECTTVYGMDDSHRDLQENTEIVEFDTEIDEGYMPLTLPLNPKLANLYFRDNLPLLNHDISSYLIANPSISSDARQQIMETMEENNKKPNRQINSMPMLNRIIKGLFGLENTIYKINHFR